jgi:hypothetical protein
MLDRLLIDENVPKDENIASILKLAKSICDKLLQEKLDCDLANYKYDFSEPISELGLEEELITHLLEDYIYQIFNSYKSFVFIVQNLENVESEAKETYLNELKDLAHKNLGVARNLRVYDAQFLLTELMNNNSDIEHVKDCIEALMACAFKLNPAYAYGILKLRQIKGKL